MGTNLSVVATDLTGSMKKGGQGGQNTVAYQVIILQIIVQTYELLLQQESFEWIIIFRSNKSLNHVNCSYTFLMPVLSLCVALEFCEDHPWYLFLPPEKPKTRVTIYCTPGGTAQATISLPSFFAPIFLHCGVESSFVRSFTKDSNPPPTFFSLSLSSFNPFFLVLLMNSSWQKERNWRKGYCHQFHQATA